MILANPYYPLVLRSRAKRGVSKDAPERVNEPCWIILRHAMLRIAAQDEVAEDALSDHVGSFSRSRT